MVLPGPLLAKSGQLRDVAERPLRVYSVEKLRFEDSGDFICDLSDIAYCSYEGVVEVA